MRWTIIFWVACLPGLVVGAPVRMATAHLKVVVEPERGELVELADGKSAKNLIASSGRPAPLWQLEWAGNIETLTATNAKSCTWERLPSGVPGVRIAWTQFAAPFSDLGVEVVVRLEPALALSRWQMRVTGTGGRALRNVSFPRVPNLARQENERLAVPVWMGQQTAEPRRLLSGQANRGSSGPIRVICPCNASLFTLNRGRDCMWPATTPRRSGRLLPCLASHRATSVAR
jgi:hypothetical protein